MRQETHLGKQDEQFKLAMGILAVSGVPRGGGWGVQTPPPKFLSFDKVEPDCKLSGKCSYSNILISLKIAEFRTPTPQDVGEKRQ